MVMPSPYRSPMIRPFQVTTNAAVIPSVGSNATSMARPSFFVSSPGGSGSSDRTSPMGHGWREGSGNVLAISTGMKNTSSSPIGRVTHPWSPLSLAVRMTPFGSVRCTRRRSESMTRLVTWARCSYGALKKPTFSAAKSASSPVTNTAEQRVLAKPEVWCVSESPGGATYLVSSSAASRASEQRVAGGLRGLFRSREPHAPDAPHQHHEKGADGGGDDAGGARGHGFCSFAEA